MAIDLIIVHEDEINRLNASIQIGEQLYKNHQLNNNEYDQLVKDIGRRHMLQLDLETLKDERDSRIRPQNN